MQEEQGNEKRCWSCGHFYAYYTKGYIQFDKEKIGYCRHEKKIIRNNGTCKNWVNNHWRKSIRQKISLKKFSEMIDLLLALLQIFKEEPQFQDFLLSEKREERLIQEYQIHDITESDEP